MDLEWMTPAEASIRWGIKVRRVQAMCLTGKIVGAFRLGRMWLIPQHTSKPIDGRTKKAKQ